MRIMVSDEQEAHGDKAAAHISQVFEKHIGGLSRIETQYFRHDGHRPDDQRHHRHKEQVVEDLLMLSRDDIEKQENNQQCCCG